ncbi:hypothetical protein CBR_g24134 [Chara braunii]|uniref:Proteasome activator Blm10 mid region domain-containing protein n=1 Tax=Chara braunii TaxID=69332 RepID=A0A388L5Z1_CHABU|nr:hypothetical protein CBR_g24134 [Chara braunii]|eukprot:GBG77688.1 hypothetical protein CBR_g24134 [Chara braunii]
MHLCNEWLPPVLVESVERLEPARFALLAKSLVETWERARQRYREADDSTDSEVGIYGAGRGRRSAVTTIKWISVINSFLNTKTEFAISDVESVCNVALDVVIHTEDLFTQLRWAQTLVRILAKYKHKLRITIPWRVLYKIIQTVHSQRRQSYGGTALLQIHLAVFSTLIHRARRFFPLGSAHEIWEEFRPGFSDLDHNDAMEAVGYLALFMPTCRAKQLGERWDESGKWSLWVEEWMELWSAVPRCNYWGLKWLSLLTRCMKHLPSHAVNWEPHVPSLFALFLNAFEVPVGKCQAQSPIHRGAPSEAMRMFWPNQSGVLSKIITKAIVLLLGPGSSAQERFDTLVNFLEQYYHPSNGGSWTSSLERLLRYLVYYFHKRLAYEHRGEWSEAAGYRPPLGKAERKAFVTAVLKFVARAQFSKSGTMAGTAANCVRQLAYVEPEIVLPFALSRFETAMETVTATHQLVSAITTIALSVRAILLASSPDRMERQDEYAIDFDKESTMDDGEQGQLNGEYGVSLALGRELIAEAMLRTLPGIDANDPPKTVATLQFYYSVFSSIGCIGEEDSGKGVVIPLDWSVWLEEFLSRMLTLLMHLEPDPESSNESSTFLIQGGSPFRQTMELLFGLLSPALYRQGLRKVTKFIQTSVLPGAASEIGILCLNVTNANPVEASRALLPPIIESILSLLEGTPRTGGSGGLAPDGKKLEKWPIISDALETSVTYYLNVICTIITFGGQALLPYKEQLLQVIAAAFDAPSNKICGGGKWVLSSLLGSLIHYFPLDEVKERVSLQGASGVDRWIGTKGNKRPPPGMKLKWHIPCPEEVGFANELLDLHLKGALADLVKLCSDDGTGIEKDGTGEGRSKNGNGNVEREYFRVVLLRLDAALWGTWTCLPDFSHANTVKDEESVELLSVVGSIGVRVGTPSLREETAQVLHMACEYMMKERADDTTNMTLLLRIIDSVANYGAGEYGEWAHAKHAWAHDARNLTEPRVNFMSDNDGYGKSSSARRPLERILKRYPSLIDYCLPTLNESLLSTAETDEAAMGACALYASRPIMRRVTQDWHSMSQFIVALLGSAHHETVKAQGSIGELFMFFVLRYGGVPGRPWHKRSSDGKSDLVSYRELVGKVRDMVSHAPETVHWRYTLMANTTLMLLVAPEYTASQVGGQELRRELADHFLSSLASDLPPLRPLAVIALLVLIQKSPADQSPPMRLSTSDPSGKPWNISIQEEEHKGHQLPDMEGGEVASSHGGAQLHRQQLCETLIKVIQREGFPGTMLSNLALDHHLAEGAAGAGDRSTGQARTSRAADPGASLLRALGIWTLVMEWPRSKNRDSLHVGTVFSLPTAEFWERLMDMFADFSSAVGQDEVLLNAIREPLEAAIATVDDRQKQCMAAEVVAGLLHSGGPAVVRAWGSWLRSTVTQALQQCTVELMSEWAACVRYIATGKGQCGLTPPKLRRELVVCLMEPVPASAGSGQIVKRLGLLGACLGEMMVPPADESEDDFDVALKNALLDELQEMMNNSARQVREAVGKLLSMLCGKLLKKQLKAGNKDEEALVAKVNAFCKFLVARASALAVKIQALGNRRMTSGPGTSRLGTTDVVDEDMGMGSSSEDGDGQEAFRWMETVRAFKLHAVIDYKHTFVLEKNDLDSLRAMVLTLLSDPQLEVREIAASTLAGLLKGADDDWPASVRSRCIEATSASQAAAKGAKKIRMQSTTITTLPATGPGSVPAKHGPVLGLSACVLSSPYDLPRWLPEVLMVLARSSHEKGPIGNTVMRTFGEFKRTHADTWMVHGKSFSEEQLEVLGNLTVSPSYFV